MDMEKLEEVKQEILQDNKPCIPLANIKYLGWLSRAAGIIVFFPFPFTYSLIIRF
jgi:hypothetical protein